MLSNLHTHTTYCDGKDTPEAIVQYAIDRGFSSVGFSGHCRTDFDLRYCMKDPDTYLAHIRYLKEEYKDKIPIFIGIEEDTKALICRDDFDYIIGACHYVEIVGQNYPIDCDLEEMDRAIAAVGGDPIKFAELYFQTFCEYIKVRKPDIVAHFDLITKYDEKMAPYFLGNPIYEEMSEKYMEEALKYDCIFEINSGAIARVLRTTPYPHERLLHCIKKRDGKMILSSDCHSADKLDFYFEEMLALLRDVGFTHVYHLTKDGFRKASI